MAESPCASAAADRSPEAGTLGSGDDKAAGVGTPVPVGGAELSAIDGSSPSMFPGLITETAVLVSGSGTNGGTVVGRPTPTGDVLVGAAVEDVDEVGFGFAEDLLGDGFVDGGAVTLTELAAIGRLVIGGLVAACAVAVSDTALAPLEGAVTEAVIVNEDGVVDVASGPSSQPAPPLPLGHIPVNEPRAPEGPTLRLTHAEGVGPNGAHTFTVNDTAWPPWTLDCDRVTLTHSAGGESLAATPAEPAESSDALTESAEPPDALELPDALEDALDDEDALEDADAELADAEDEAAADGEEDVDPADESGADGEGDGEADAEATGRYSHCAPGGSAKAAPDAKATLPPGQATTPRTTPAAVATTNRRRTRRGRGVSRLRRR